MAGFPAGVDLEYERRFPAWREAFAGMRSNILNQYRASRESCARIQVRGDRWIESSGLTLHDLERESDDRAREVLERCIRRREDIIEVK